MTQAAISSLADQLHYASAEYRRSRARLPHAGPWKISELPDPTPAEIAARAELRSIGRRLYDTGGDALMEQVFDEAVERYGHRGVIGVVSSWDRIGAWLA